MHPADTKFIGLARRFAAVGVQAAQAYNQEQAKLQLQLELVLSQEQLSSHTGMQLSLATTSTLKRNLNLIADRFLQPT